MPDTISKSKLIDDFINAGVEKGDMIMLHSSLKSVGWVEAGANTVVDALLDIIGEEGTLAVPTYTYSYIGREGVVAYDKRKSSSSNGVITEALWQRSGAHRSDQPTHSVAANGKQAEFLTHDHPLDKPFGLGSPLHKLAGAGGKILLLGVGHNRNSLIHVVEIVAGIKYNYLPFKESWGTAAIRINDNNEEEVIVQKEFPGCSHNFGVIEEQLKSEGIVKSGTAGNAVTQIMKAQDVIDLVIMELKKKPDFLLCDRQECECCTNRKKLINS